MRLINRASCAEGNQQIRLARHLVFFIVTLISETAFITVRLIPKLSLRSKIFLAISGSPRELEDPYRTWIGRCSIREGPSFVAEVRPCSALRFVGGGGGSGTSEVMFNKLWFS